MIKFRFTSNVEHGRRNTIAEIDLGTGKVVYGTSWQHANDKDVKVLGQKFAVRNALTHIQDKGIRTKAWKAFFAQLNGKSRRFLLGDDKLTQLIIEMQKMNLMPSTEPVHIIPYKRSEPANPMKPILDTICPPVEEIQKEVSDEM